jgi:two-component system, cell cycle sensor histidine kinase and response regulator CckA
MLITDVIMPEMTGRDLAKQVLSLYPQARCLFMSGYTADVIAYQGKLDEGVLFLQKPFTTQDLLNLVRKGLGG